MTGIMTLSWNWPPAAPHKASVWSLPMTLAATCIRLSHITGLTLPGMMELPGWSSASLSSWNPHRGPDASHRRLLATLKSVERCTATRRGIPQGRRAARWPRSDSPLDEAESGLLGQDFATRRPKSRCVFRPVPTPSRRPAIRARLLRMRGPTDRAFQLPRQPADLLPRASGVASVRCVRPVLMMSIQRAALTASTSRQRDSAEPGRGRCLARPHVDGRGEHVVGALAQVHVVVRMDRLLGPNRSPPANSMARLAITSLRSCCWRCRSRSGKRRPGTGRRISLQRPLGGRQQCVHSRPVRGRMPGPGQPGGRDRGWQAPRPI